MEDSLERGDKSTLVYLWLGHIYQAQNENAKAILSYEKSDLPAAYDNLGLLYLEQGDLDKAYSNLKKSPVELHLANYYFIAKDYGKAKAGYEAALKRNPKLLAARLNLGLLALAEKQYEAAHTSFMSFLEEAKPDASLKTRVQSYLKLVNQKIKLEKQRHENKT